MIKIFDYFRKSVDDIGNYANMPKPNGVYWSVKMDIKAAVAKIADSLPKASIAHFEEANLLEVDYFDSQKVKALFGHNPNVLTISDTKVCIILDLI